MGSGLIGHHGPFARQLVSVAYPKDVGYVTIQCRLCLVMTVLEMMRSTSYVTLFHVQTNFPRVIGLLGQAGEHVQLPVALASGQETEHVPS